MSAAHQHTNRLIHSTSPYLLQHAHNPVDWYPWGPEAFERARAEDKPIFLSVGYSTCYWCHVMERQSFENEDIAARMNELFVCIKVDREERPDVDQVYMTAVQVLTRQGGWPMSVFLTPDLKPFFGGTYFPPEDGYGRPGFPRVLESISQAYRTKREQVEKSAAEITHLIGRVAEPRSPQGPIRVDLNWVEALLERSTADYDQCYGGFSGAPKFPRQTLLELVLAYSALPEATEDAKAMREMALHSLDAMADGGIRDQLGGAFHRYSTDERWLVPHFEIMLYDNAMLAVCYAEAYRQTGKGTYEAVLREVLDFVLRKMTSPAGPFYTAIDAEVDAMEGGSYVWTRDEVVEALRAAGKGNALIDRFGRVYGLDEGPNFADPHGGSQQPDRNVLYVANATGGTERMHPVLDPELREMRSALYAARRERKQPLLDTKILTSWNALMIRGMAVAGGALREPRYLQAAAAAADWLLANHRLGDGTLVRTSRPDAADGAVAAPRIEAFLDDYAFLAQALLALYETSGERRWREEAMRVVETMKDKFLDKEYGGFYFTPAEATDLIVRQKTGQDSPLPSGNAVAAMALLELGEVEEARRTLAAWAQSMEDHAEAMSAMVQGGLGYLRRHEPFVVSAGGAEEAERVASPDQVARQVVDLSAAWASATELRVTVRIVEGYHLNANRAAQGLVPTTLTVAGLREPEVRVEYPPGEERAFGFTTEAIRVYEREVLIVVRFARAPAGRVRVGLTYQPCTEDACLSAVTKQVEVGAA
jgi:uncharacterized protein YyaL (SSP411 family)